MKKLNTVIVVDEDLQFLSSTSPARARKLMKKGKATLYQYKPFIIKHKGAKLQIVFENDPLFQPVDMVHSNVSAKREFNFKFTSVADTVKKAQEYFEGGRDEELDKFISNIIKIAKEELYANAKAINADALANVVFDVQHEQLKSDIVVTVVYQAVALKKK